MIRRTIAALAAAALVLAACTTPTPPVGLLVTNLSPADGASDVAIDTAVAATFNRAVDVETIADAFVVTSDGGDVAGNIEYDADVRTLTFTPTAPLEYATTYTATVDGGVAAPGGLTLGADATWSFTTVAEPGGDAIGGITVDPVAAELAIGALVQLVAELTGVVGTPDLGITWTSDDATVATVDDDGLVTAEAEGTATVTATSDFDGSVSATAAITVTPASIGGYTIDGPESPLAVDATAQLTATAVDVVGSPDTTVTWSSGDEDVATVGAETGEVTAVAPGTATMTATSVFDPTVSATFDVEVAAPLEAVGTVSDGVTVGYVADLDAGAAIDPALAAPFTGGVAPYTFAVVAPADAPYELQGLPPGTTVDADTGELSGTPGVARFYNFAVEATDAIGQTAIAYGEVDVALVLTYASTSYVYDNTVAPATVVPGSDVTVVGADPEDDLTFSITAVETDPAGGVVTDWSVAADGSITYDVAGPAYVWTLDVTVIDEVTGASATAVLTFEPVP